METNKGTNRQECVDKGKLPENMQLQLNKSGGYKT